MSSTAKNFDRESARRIRSDRHDARSSWRVVASSGLHAFPALVGRDLFYSLVAYRICDLLAVALSLDYAALWRWCHERAHLHPWFGLLFEVFFLFQFINWFAPMAWVEADRRWMRRIRQYATNEDRIEAEDVGFFNAGQKTLLLGDCLVSAILFLITGVLMWFDDVVPRWVVAVSYVIHDLAALLMLAGFIIHVYEGTAHQPGTFRSMMDGTVTERWAWTHHPGWYRALTGRDPREAYEREKRRQEER